MILTSCDALKTAGLGELIEKYHVEVVAPAEGIADLTKACPPQTRFIAANLLAAKGWVVVATHMLDGRGNHPIAYQFELSGKRVLCSGIIPVKVNQPVGERLIYDLTHAPGDPERYASALAQLDSIAPELWLPTLPSDDQNANLYDEEWQNILRDNFDVVRFIEARRRPE